MKRKLNHDLIKMNIVPILGYEPDYVPGYLEPEVRVPFNSTNERSIPYLMLMPEDVEGNSFVIIAMFLLLKNQIFRNSLKSTNTVLTTSSNV